MPFFAGSLIRPGRRSSGRKHRLVSDGHSTTRFIPNRTRRDGSALLSRMTERANAETAEPAGAAVLPKYSR